MRPLGKMAGDIRTAWTLSRSAEQLDEALAARGLSLAEVSAIEARQSERTAAFAKENPKFLTTFAAVIDKNSNSFLKDRAAWGPDSDNAKALAKLLGGRGTMNVPSWSPDSKMLAFTSYELLP